MANIEIDAGDILRLMMQFMREQGLDKSLKSLQDETGVALNTLDNADGFSHDVLAGRWNAVLSTVSTLKLPPHVLMNLYEQIVREMVEQKEQESARTLLKTTLPMMLLKQDDPMRYARLENLVNRGTYDPTELYPDGLTKERRRTDLLRNIIEHTTSAPPARLVALLGQALKWQQHTGQLPAGSRVDLLQGAAAARRVEEELVCKSHTGITIKFGAAAKPEAAAYVPNGTSIVTGSVDGIIEVYDAENGRLRMDLAYQAQGGCHPRSVDFRCSVPRHHHSSDAQGVASSRFHLDRPLAVTPLLADEFMLHDDAILCLAVSPDSELLASGSKDAKIKIWRLSNGECLRKFIKPHGDTNITCLAFSRDSSQLLSGGQDGVGRIFGLRSGKCLKEFRGHSAYISACAWLPDGAHVITSSADGSCKIWDIKSSDCVHTIKPPQLVLTSDAPVLSILPLPRTADQVVVLSRGPAAHLMTASGGLVRAFTHGKRAGTADFVAAALSPSGKWLYCVGEDGNLYVFSVQSGAIEYQTMSFAKPKVAAGSAGAAADGGSGAGALHDRSVTGLAHHPYRSQLASWSDDGTLKVWRP